MLIASNQYVAFVELLYKSSFTLEIMMGLQSIITALISSELSLRTNVYDRITAMMTFSDNISPSRVILLKRQSAQCDQQQNCVCVCVRS